MSHFREHLMIALKAALTAGEVILEVYRKPSYAKELKSDFTPVTEADREAHTVIMEKLRPSGFPILSEEGRKIRYEERKGWETFWLVDPHEKTASSQ